MRIDWLTDDCTEAIVTRGWFRVRQARVTWQTVNSVNAWRYASGDDASELSVELHAARDIELNKRKRQRNWTAPQLPPARMVRR